MCVRLNITFLLLLLLYQVSMNIIGSQPKIVGKDVMLNIAEYIPADAKVITKEAKRCSCATYFTHENGQKMDCTQFCMENMSKWLPQMMINDFKLFENENETLPALDLVLEIKHSRPFDPEIDFQQFEERRDEFRMAILNAQLVVHHRNGRRIAYSLFPLYDESKYNKYDSEYYQQRFTEISQDIEERIQLHTTHNPVIGVEMRLHCLMLKREEMDVYYNEYHDSNAFDHSSCTEYWEEFTSRAFPTTIFGRNKNWKINYHIEQPTTDLTTIPWEFEFQMVLSSYISMIPI